MRAIFGRPTITAGARQDYPRKAKDGSPLPGRFNATMANLTFSLGGVFELTCHVYRDRIIDGARTEDSYSFSVPKAGKLIASDLVTDDELNFWQSEQLTAWDQWSQRTAGSDKVSAGSNKPRLVRVTVAAPPAAQPTA